MFLKSYPVPTKVWATALALKVWRKCDSQVWKPVAGVNGTELLVSLRGRLITGE